MELDDRLRTKGHGNGLTKAKRKQKPPASPETLDLLERIAAQQAQQSKPDVPPDPTTTTHDYTSDSLTTATKRGS